MSADKPTLVDLEFAYFGGGVDEKYQALEAFAGAGVSASALLALTQGGTFIVEPSAANDGDVLTFDDASGEWVAAAPTGGGGSSREVRADYVSPYSYIGTASAGSLEDAAVWTITRIEVTDPVVVDVATGVAWDDRLTIGFGV
jgi:hypothetical protein